MTFSIPAVLLAATAATGDPATVDSVSAALATRIESAPVVRLAVAEGPRRVGHASVSPEGVRFGGDFGRLARRAGGTLVSWSDIRGVEIGHTRMGTGAVLGIVGGVAAAIAWNAADPPESDAGFLRFGPTKSAKVLGRCLLLGAAGAAIGGGIGYQLRTWEPIYP